nr:GtrA family protein [uncultured Mediterraneibacter sp.]
MKLKKELFTYLVSGGITTAVNYMLYLALMWAGVPYLIANSIAWVGAVLTAYALNRLWVFRSKKQMGAELASFAALRFITLVLENALLWLLISRLDAAALPAKLIVSVVTVIGNYVLCKFGIFKKEVICRG